MPKKKKQCSSAHLLTVFINLCNKIFYKIHELFLYKSLESIFDLAIEDLKAILSPKVISLNVLYKNLQNFTWSY